MTPVLLADRFELGEFLGAGGMGEVFAAWDRREARRVAVKRLRPAAAESTELVRHFAREGAILRTAAHPNIVSVLAVVTDPTGPSIVMEYVPGGTLEELLRREPRLPLDRVLTIALDLCDALARAHRLGVVHRDLKPANVLLAEDGTPRLTDFGVASMAGTGVRTGPGAFVGTLPYMPPESWDNEDSGTRTDIWALGVMLYEMLAGRRPFTAEHLGILHAAISVSEPTPLGTLRTDAPPSLVDAISRMLVKDPARRMTSVRELGLVVERLVRGEEPGGLTRVLEAGMAAAGAAPRPGTALIGREQQVTELLALLGDPRIRMLTLTGPGGAGKTRLAIAALEAVRGRFPEGAVFVDLTPVTDPGLVLPALARALEVEEDLHRPLVDVLAESLGATRRLVLLDNFEQVLAAGTDVARLLAAAPGLTVLVTSRFLLRVTNEHEYAVPPLPLPDSGTSLDPVALLRNPAVALFVQRAQLLDPGFTLDRSNAAAVAEICRRLDGLPLAIELAAGRSRVLPPTRLLGHLDQSLALLTTGAVDRAPHQRTLRRTIEWSVGLLDERQQALFVRLAVFVGGWTLDDALAVLGNVPAGGWDLPALVDGLQSLVEKNLLTVRHIGDEVRYGMLETVRSFAREAFDRGSEAAALSARHASHFLATAERWDLEVSTAEQAEAITRCAASHDNFRAALAWLDANQPAALPALAGSLGRFWYLAGHWREALGWYARALKRAPAAPAESRARVLDLEGRLEMFLGEERAALDHHREAWSLVSARGEARLRARVSEGFGEVLLKVGDTARATRVLEESVEIARTTDHPGTLAESLTTLATARVGSGELAAAEGLLVEALALGQAQGDRFQLSRIYYYLAGLALLRGEQAVARTRCEEGRRVAADSGDAAWACHLDEMLARVSMAEGRWAEARAMLRHSLHAFTAVGSRTCLPHSFEAVARLHLMEANRGIDTSRRLREAARVIGAAETLCRALAIAMLPVERALLEETVEGVRHALGGAEYTTAWEAGAAATEEEAIAAAAAAIAQEV